MSAVLHLDDLRVPVETGGTSRKARLTIEADGSLRLRAAEDVATDELRQFLASKREWVYRKLAEKEVLQHEPVTKELVDGEGFLYLGRSHRLKIDDVDGAVRLERGRLVLPRPLAEAGEASRHRLVPAVRRGVAASPRSLMGRAAACRTRRHRGRRPRPQVGKRNRRKARAHPLGDVAAISGAG